MKLTKNDNFYIQSIDRALNIIENIANEGENGISLTSLAKKVNIPNSTVYRILENLISWQYIKENENGMYSLGLEFIKLGNIATNAIGLNKIARKYIEQLGEITKETVYLSILDEKSGKIMYIDKMDSQGNIKLAAGIGTRNFINSTANGKVLVSNLSDEKVKELLSIAGMPKLTSATIDDEDKFIEEIRKTQKLGYALDNLENEPGVRCVAAPVFDYSRKVIASLSISGVESNMSINIIENKYKTLVIETANKISSELGFRK